MQVIYGEEPAPDQRTAKLRHAARPLRYSRMLSAISRSSKTFFQSSRMSMGLPNWIALLQASEKTPAAP